MLITKDTKLSEAVLKNYQLIPIISRFGIKFGFADKTVEQVCTQYDIHCQFFLEIVNAFNDQNYKPYNNLRKMSLFLIVNYLLKSHRYYNYVKLPIIEDLIEQLEWEQENDTKNKAVLKKFFSQYRKEVIEHTANEEKEIYPYVLELEKNYNREGKPEELFSEKIRKKSIRDYAASHDELNSALLDLKNIIIKYLHPAKNNEITEQILVEIFKLEKDMTDHTELEDEVVIPAAVMMEKELKKRGR